LISKYATLSKKPADEFALLFNGKTVKVTDTPEALRMGAENTLSALFMGSTCLIVVDVVKLPPGQKATSSTNNDVAATATEPKQTPTVKQELPEFLPLNQPIPAFQPRNGMGAVAVNPASLASQMLARRLQLQRDAEKAKLEAAHNLAREQRERDALRPAQQPLTTAQRLAQTGMPVNLLQRQLQAGRPGASQSIPLPGGLMTNMNPHLNARQILSLGNDGYDSDELVNNGNGSDGMGNYGNLTYGNANYAKNGDDDEVDEKEVQQQLEALMETFNVEVAPHERLDTPECMNIELKEYQRIGVTWCDLFLGL
jgi:hypothetical protein